MYKPERIWVDPNMPEGEEWSIERDGGVSNFVTEYVRADKYAELTAKVVELKETVRVFKTAWEGRIGAERDHA